MGKNRAGEGERQDVYQAVTDQVIALLERGTQPGQQRWTSSKAGFPLRHNGQRYRGINVLILWGAQIEAGYDSPFWMSYRQATELGGQVRKGERGTMSVFYGTAADQTETDGEGGAGEGEKRFRFLKSYYVFNACQIDGLPERYQVKSEAAKLSPDARLPELEAFTRAVGAEVRHSGSRAFYNKADDFIGMPPFEAFVTPELYYATLAHELTHWTRHPSRLERDFGQQVYGDAGYAKEELVAELGSAFLGAEFGFPPEHIEDHAAYIGSWLKALKDDKKLIFVAAAKAQQAVDFLLARAGIAQQVAA